MLLILVPMMVALGVLMILRIPTVSDRTEHGDFAEEEPRARFRQLQIGMASINFFTPEPIRGGYFVVVASAGRLASCVSGTARR